MKRVLAITLDGILQPIAYSQVVRVAAGLAATGIPYAIASLERARDLASHAHVARVRAVLDAASIPWEAEVFEEGGGGRAIATNLARITRAAHTLARREPVSVMHARAITGGLAARALHTLLGTPYLFDARAYWVDEQIEEGRRFTTPRAFRAAKAIEREIFSRAAGVVTLTTLQADDVRAGMLGPHRGRPVETIPTCADYDEFRIAPPGTPRPEPLARFAGDTPVLAIVGALNRSYCARESVELAARALARAPSLRLVVLSAQQKEYAALLDEVGIPRERALVTSVPHDRMPEWTAHLTWAVLLLRSPFAKRASMPTKLAELFASGVRPLEHGCNAEVSGWVERAGSGLVLPGIEPAHLDAAADFVARATAEPREAQRPLLERAREITAPHFSLASGIARYRAILRAIG